MEIDRSTKREEERENLNWPGLTMTSSLSIRAGENLWIDCNVLNLTASNPFLWGDPAPSLLCGLTNWTNGIHSCHTCCLPHKSDYDNILSGGREREEGETNRENVAFPFAICSLEFIAAACQDLRILAWTSYVFQLQLQLRLPAPTTTPDDRWQAIGAAWLGCVACCMPHVAAFGSLCKLVKVSREIGATNNGELR